MYECPQRGEVFLIKTITGKYQPAVIVSNDKTCENMDGVNYVPFSNNVSNPQIPVYVGIYPSKSNGLKPSKDPCYACCNRVGFAYKMDLAQYLGSLSETDMNAIGTALCVAMDLFFEPKTKEQPKVEPQPAQEPKEETPTADQGVFLKTPVFGIGLELEKGMYMLQLVKKNK